MSLTIAMITLREIFVPVFVLCVIGILAYLVSIAPFIDGTIKTFIKWGLIVVGVLYLIYYIAGMLGIS